MPNAPFVSVEEYLNTSYDPDVEYIDGVLVERNVGDWLHSWVQTNLLVALRNKYPFLKTVGELRSKVTDTRYRLPDVCSLLEAPHSRFLIDAAYLVIEVLSPDDRMSALIEKLQEYHRKGVKNIWVFDPRLHQMFDYDGSSLREVSGDSIRTADGQVELTAAEIFAE